MDSVAEWAGVRVQRAGPALNGASLVARMGRVMRLENAQALEVQLLKKCDFSAARMTMLRPNHGMVGPLPSEDAYLLSLQLRDFVAHDLWVGGRPVRTEPAPAGTFRLLHLREETAAFLRDPFDSVHFYIYRESLRTITEEEEAREVEDFGVPPANAYDDPVVRNLGAAILPALAAPHAAPALFVEHVSIALHVHLAQKYGRVRLRPRPARGKLAAWQERRAKEMMIAGIRGEATLTELARECGLSRSHFARAFKATTGSSPHRWLQARRVERASELLENSTLPVGEIARQLGFADQSHFTRVFRRSIGETPRAWRRQRRE